MGCVPSATRCFRLQSGLSLLGQCVEAADVNGNLDWDGSMRWSTTGRQHAGVAVDAAKYDNNRSQIDVGGALIEVPEGIHANQDFEGKTTVCKLTMQDDRVHSSSYHIAAGSNIASIEKRVETQLGDGVGSVIFTYQRPFLKVCIPVVGSVETPYIHQVLLGVELVGELRASGGPGQSTRMYCGGQVRGAFGSHVKVKVCGSNGRHGYEFSFTANGPPVDWKEMDGCDLPSVMAYVSSTWAENALQQPATWQVLNVKVAQATHIRVTRPSPAECVPEPPVIPGMLIDSELPVKPFSLPGMPMSAGQAVRRHFLFVGNPGVGKSCMLNGLAGQLLFKSGISYGSGLTTVLQIEEVNGMVYVDTPGLADANLREQAAEEITRALKMDGYYHIFFVLTLQAGRVNPTDKATMQIILEAAPDITNYAVIFNKLSKKEHMDLTRRGPEWDKIQASLAAEGDCMANSFTDQVFFNRRVDELEDGVDVLYTLPSDLKKFIMNASGMLIQSTNVKDISVARYDEQVQKLEEQIQVILNDNKRLQEVLEQSSASAAAKHAKMQMELEEQTRSYQEKLQAAAEASQKAIAEIQESMQKQHAQATRELQTRIVKAREDSRKELEQKLAEERHKLHALQKKIDENDAKGTVCQTVPKMHATGRLNVGAYQSEKVLECLRSWPGSSPLQELKVGHDYVSDDAWATALAQLLPLSLVRLELHLNSCCVGDVGIGRLALKLPAGLQVLRLSISYNANVTADAIHAITRHLPRALKSLYVWALGKRLNNQLFLEACEQLRQAVIARGGESFIYSAQAHPNWDSGELVLRENDTGDSVLQILETEQKVSSLRALDVAPKSSADDDWALSFSALIPKNLISLKLDLRYSKVGDVGMSHLFKELPAGLKTMTLIFSLHVTMVTIDILTQCLPAGIQKLALEFRLKSSSASERRRIATQLDFDRIIKDVQHAVHSRGATSSISGIPKMPSNVYGDVLEFGFALSDEVLRVLRERGGSHSLKKLTMDTDIDADNAWAEAVAKLLPASLVHLELRLNSSKVGDEGVKALAQRLPQGLESLKLDFAYSKNVTEIGIEQLAQHLPSNLKFLELGLECVFHQVGPKVCAKLEEKACACGATCKISGMVIIPGEWP